MLKLLTYQKCLLIVLIIGLMFGIYYFAPYDQDIWGTVGDWVMILVTALSAIFLVLTFKAQQAITRIELSKYKGSFLPEIQLQLKENAILVTVTKQPIVTLHTYYNPSNNFGYKNNHQDYGAKNSYDELEVGGSFRIDIDRRPAKERGATKRGHALNDEIYIFFTDSEGHLYEQTIVYEPLSNHVRKKRPKYISTNLDAPGAIAKERQLVPNQPS